MHFKTALTLFQFKFISGLKHGFGLFNDNGTQSSMFRTNKKALIFMRFEQKDLKILILTFKNHLHIFWINSRWSVYFFFFFFKHACLRNFQEIRGTENSRWLQNGVWRKYYNNNANDTTTLRWWNQNNLKTRECGATTSCYIWFDASKFAPIATTTQNLRPTSTLPPQVWPYFRNSLPRVTPVPLQPSLLDCQHKFGRKSRGFVSKCSQPATQKYLREFVVGWWVHFFKPQDCRVSL